MICPRCATENADSAKFCSECGALLAASRPREQRKTVTVLFCDVSGSTSLGERIDPEALRGIMSRYFEAARTAIERHGGTVEKFIGDAVMAVFGVPTVHEDDALRAVRAAVELRDSVEIDVRIGVNTGEVVTGGTDTLATGDAVNVAARLEQAAASGEVLIGEQTHALVRDAVDAELLPPLEAKGKSEPLTAYRLLSVTGGLHRRDTAPMVGRTRELELLRRAYERTVEDRACHLFTVLGTAGIGKSRLVSEFLADLPGARVVVGRCLSYGEGITYWPVVEILKQLDAPVESLLREGTSPPEIAWGVRKMLEQSALDTPLVVVFDDIQWGEATFLDLIEHVADLSRDAPILLLCMARPELLDVRPGWAGGKLNATTALLEPLARDAVDELLRSLAGEVDERIREAADGNPLFIEEMVELARASNGVVAVPPTIHALLTARLDSLPAEERVVLERGAVEGQVFHRNAVAALAPEEQQVDTRLVSLVRKELVRPDHALLAADDAYRFRHLLIRDAAYEALPKATRIELHERFAMWLEEHGADLVELDEILGYHLEQAVHYAAELGREAGAPAAEAARRLAAAAFRADARGDAEAAIKLSRRALALLADDDEARPHLQLHLANALFDVGEFDEAESILAELAGRGDRALTARVTILVHTTGPSLSSNAESRRAVEAAIAELEAADDLAGLAQAYVALALHSQWAGDTERAADAALRARELARRTGDLRLEVRATEAIGQTLVWTRTPWSVIDALAREWEADERLGRRLQSRVHMLLARSAAARRAFAEAHEHFEAARTIFDELGLAVLRGAMEMNAASTAWLEGDVEATERWARECWDRLGALGEGGYRSTGGTELAEVLVRTGRLAEAEAIVTEAESLTMPDDYVTAMHARAIRGMLAGRAGDHARALELLEQAVGMVDATPDLENRCRAQILLAEELVAAGRRTEAEELVAATVSLAEAKENLALADRARMVLR